MGVHQDTPDDDAHVIAVIERWRLVRCNKHRRLVAQERRDGAKLRPWVACPFVLNAKALGHVLEGATLAIPAHDLAALSALTVGAWVEGA